MHQDGAAHAKRLDEWYALVRDEQLTIEVARAVQQLVAEVERLSQSPHESIRPPVARPLACWMALCGAAGVESIEAMIWTKYPGVCPHCHENPHDRSTCVGRTAGVDTLDWPTLRRLASDRAASRPATIAEWQRMFGEIYERPASATAVARLAEELDELVDAIDRNGTASRRFRNEASDVFAWLMQLQNAFDHEADVAEADVGLSIERALAAACGRADRDVEPSAHPN